MRSVTGNTYLLMQALECFIGKDLYSREVLPERNPISINHHLRAAFGAGYLIELKSKKPKPKLYRLTASGYDFLFRQRWLTIARINEILEQDDERGSKE